MGCIGAATDPAPARSPASHHLTPELRTRNRAYGCGRGTQPAAHCCAHFSHALADPYGAVYGAVLYWLLTLPSQERDANLKLNQKERQANLELVQRSAASAAELSKRERDENMLKNAAARTQLEDRLNAALASLAPAPGGDGLTRTPSPHPNPSPNPNPSPKP